jgi:hypothetical protein
LAIYGSPELIKPGKAVSIDTQDYLVGLGR